LETSLRLMQRAEEFHRSGKFREALRYYHAVNGMLRAVLKAREKGDLDEIKRQLAALRRERLEAETRKQLV